MNIVSLNIAPTINYAPAPPMLQSPPFNLTLTTPAAPASKPYTVSVTAQFDTEGEARAFARDILSIAGYKEEL